MINARVMLLLGIEAIRGGNFKFFLNTLAGPILIFLLLLVFVSLKAALIMLAVALGFFLIALGIAAAQMEKLLDIRLEPWPFRAVVNRDQITRLAEDLTRLGFIPAGMFKVTGRDLYVEGWTHPDLKVYAMITSGDENVDAYVEFSTSYADGGSYCVSGSKMRSVLPRPANLVNVNYSGKSSEELLGILLRCRPDYGHLDTPPEKFMENVDQEMRRTKDYLFKRAR